MGLFGRGIIGGGNSTEVRASGGEITINGDYKTHTFKSGNGSFNINYIPNGLSAISASILVVGGGGGGGARGVSPTLGVGGGGGAGGVVIVPFDSGSLPVGAWSIYVGNGGVGSQFQSGSSGENSTMISGSFTLTALGGAGGGNPSQTSLLPNGGSGGGGFGGNSGTTYPSTLAGSDGIQDIQAGDNGTYGYGADGGDGYNSPSGTPAGGGGGGATQDGLSPTAAGGSSCKGGDGITWSTSTYGGDDRTVGGGGGGGGARSTPNDNGGAGGGGIGYRDVGDPILATDGTPNTGGGGGGGAGGLPTRGGSGVVAIRYKYKNL